jgi:ketosteroid isomerase-like protein
LTSATGTDRSTAEVVREFVARLRGSGDPWALLSEHAVVIVNGTTPLSGRYPGIALIRGILVDSAKNVIASLGVSIREIIGTGARVAALLSLSGHSVAGVPFNAEERLCGCVFAVREGLIEEIILFPDTSLIEIALYQRKYVPDA